MGAGDTTWGLVVISDFIFDVVRTLFRFGWFGNVPNKEVSSLETLAFVDPQSSTPQRF